MSNNLSVNHIVWDIGYPRFGIHKERIYDNQDIKGVCPDEYGYRTFIIFRFIFFGLAIVLSHKKVSEGE